MSLATVHWSSAVLGKKTTLNVILPNVGQPPFPTLYLLHGLSDDATTWLRHTRLEYYVRELPLIVVLPDGHRSFYTDHEEGPAYARHVGEEIPAFIERTFPALAQRDARAIGGLSMGGYGALRIGLGYADRYCSVHSHSGAVGWGRFTGDSAYQEIARQRGWSPEFASELRRIFGLAPLGTHHDLIHLAQRAAAAQQLPHLALDCGTEDFLLNDNRAFTADLRQAGIPHTYIEAPGAHTWDYWDTHIQTALAFHATNLRLPSP